MRVRRLEPGGEVAEQVVPLYTPDSAERVRAAVAAGEVLTVHTEEATLEDIFVIYAGRGLAS